MINKMQKRRRFAFIVLISSVVCGCLWLISSWRPTYVHADYAWALQFHAGGVNYYRFTPSFIEENSQHLEYYLDRKAAAMTVNLVIGSIDIHKFRSFNTDWSIGWTSKKLKGKPLYRYITDVYPPMKSLISTFKKHKAFRLPFGIPFLALSGLFWWLILSAIIGEWRGWYRQQQGLCARCGYDLRATPERCPECGCAPGRIRLHMTDLIFFPMLAGLHVFGLMTFLLARSHTFHYGVWCLVCCLMGVFWIFSTRWWRPCANLLKTEIPVSKILNVESSPAIVSFLRTGRWRISGSAGKSQAAAVEMTIHRMTIRRRRAFIIFIGVLVCGFLWSISYWSPFYISEDCAWAVQLRAGGVDYYCSIVPLSSRHHQGYYPFQSLTDRPLRQLKGRLILGDFHSLHTDWSCRWKYGCTSSNKNYFYGLLRLPFGIPFLVLSGIFWWLILPMHIREWRRREQGLCIQCGYDMRTTSTSGHECGLASNAKSEHKMDLIFLPVLALLYVFGLTFVLLDWQPLVIVWVILTILCWLGLRRSRPGSLRFSWCRAPFYGGDSSLVCGFFGVLGAAYLL